MPTLCTSNWMSGCCKVKSLQCIIYYLAGLFVSLEMKLYNLSFFTKPKCKYYVIWKLVIDIELAYVVYKTIIDVAYAYVVYKIILYVVYEDIVHKKIILLYMHMLTVSDINEILLLASSKVIL